ncbi:MAG: anti-sigma factor antagonist [Pseudonocardiales bacterium]|nr:anti-sigma factor antagonist [Pseudonocardiales bacterium]
MNDSTRSEELAPLTLSADWPRPDMCVVHVVGELDIATVPDLAEYLRERTVSGPEHLVLDMAGVSLLSAVGVALLESARRNDLAIHGRLRLVGVTENRMVRRVLALTGVLDAHDVHDSLDAVLNRLDHT